MKRFALLGAAGYIAPRHMAAIRDTGNDLVAAMDPSDSVGILDSYFPQAHFFTEFERFDRHIDKLRRSGVAIHYVTVASPNYLHDSQMRFALRSGADAICEKPLVLNPWNIEGLKDIEADTGRKVHTILQLRLHPVVLYQRQKIRACPDGRKYDVDLTYVTSRGRWYFQSWKGDEKKSGGIATNIGVHFFDMLHFLFGNFQENIVHVRTATQAAGYLEFDLARVRWYLSLKQEDVPETLRAAGQRTYRSITIDGEEMEFSGGFEQLHTLSYNEILVGRGFGLDENRAAIEAVTHIRNAPVVAKGEQHPFAWQAA